MAFDDCPPSVDPAQDAVNQTRLRHAVARDARAMHSDGGSDAAAVEQSPIDQTQAELPRFSKPRLPRGYDHPARLKLANERTVRWLERCKAAHGRPHDQALFGIVQGGASEETRTWSAERVCGIELPGYAIGGVAVGERSDDIARVVRHTAPLLPWEKPRYLMGVGYERDILAAVLAGVDMFDCVLPTRNGRNANAFTPTGQVRLRNARFAEDSGPIQEGCDCAACSPSSHDAAFGDGNEIPNNSRSSRASRPAGNDSPFTRAYIRHLFLAGEMLGPILVSLHNLRYFQRFMSDLRATISTDEWGAFALRWPIASAGMPAGLVPLGPGASGHAA
ncbi:MAG: tRNA-guanine transglycosylase [Pyrinomonadaceae bacterium]|nr:tRNA-guanine transglycosylase [Phycisphaerales bacterium]